MQSNQVFNFLLSETVAIPLIIGVARFNKINASYHPFILLLLMAFTSEVISFICIHFLHDKNAITVNIYSLIESMILLYLFRSWGFLQRKQKLFYILVTLFLVLWLTEDILFLKIEEYSPFFKGAYSFIIVLLSINEINYMIVQENNQLFRNAKFLICLGFIVYFIYQIIYEASYYVLGKEKDNAVSIATSIISMFGYINASVNLLYGVAFLLIPEKKNDLYFDRHFE